MSVVSYLHVFGFFLDLPAFGIVEHEHAMETSSGGDQVMIDVHTKSS
jgi:hypothetical protein